MRILSIPVTEEYQYLGMPRYGYDLLELRLDYAVKPLTVLDSMQNHIQVNPATIITIRDPSEGGEKSVSPGHKFSFYSNIINKTGCLVDCELKLFLQYRPSLPLKNLILSHHISADCQDLSKIIFESIARANRYNISYLKLAVPIHSYDQLNQLRVWQKKSRNPLIIVGTGPLGKLSRIIWRIYGFPGTYLGLDNYKTAPEQLTPDEYELYGCEQLDQNTLIGGLIGDENVYNSLGLLFYNQKLRKLYNNVVYLPLPVNDLHDFISWLKNLNRENRFYGFSITMPHKKLLPLFFSIPNRIANLLSVSIDQSEQLPSRISDLFHNTDTVAFCKAMRILEITKENSILVYGSGATATTFITEFGSFPNIMICTRNLDKGIKYAEDHDLEFIQTDKAYDQKFDLIVNCTPLGMKEEDFFAETGLTLPKNFIDLPYKKKGLTKAIEQCKENNIPTIDGKKFWLFQAIKQEKVFSANISKLI